MREVLRPPVRRTHHFPRLRLCWRSLLGGRLRFLRHVCLPPDGASRGQSKGEIRSQPAAQVPDQRHAFFSWENGFLLRLRGQMADRLQGRRSVAAGSSRKSSSMASARQASPVSSRCCRRGRAISQQSTHLRCRPMFLAGQRSHAVPMQRRRDRPRAARPFSLHLAYTKSHRRILRCRALEASGGGGGGARLRAPLVADGCTTNRSGAPGL